jgi:AcrR family transcriptional regulator
MVEAEVMSQPVSGPDGETAKGDTLKRRQIIDGACRMFLAQGFDAASMGSIAKEAGVSKGTLYVYFKSKEELFEAIVREQSGQQAEQIFTFDADAPVAKELTRLGIEFVTFLARKQGISPLRTVMAISERMPELGKRFYEAGPALGIASLKRYLDAKVGQGQLHPHDTEVAAAQFIDSCLSLTFKPLMFNAAPLPTQAQITRVVGSAVETYVRAYGTAR